MSSSLRSILRALLVAAMPVALGACTLVGGGMRKPAPGPRPVDPGPHLEAETLRGGGRTSTAEADGKRGADGITGGVVGVALESIGTPYEWGGTDANGFDCSGLIQFAYASFGIPLPRTSAAQMRAGSAVAPEPALLRPGDLLGFSGDRSSKTEHVGLYIGGDEFIHSSSSGVRISTLRNPYWRKSLVAARRIVG